MNVTYSFDESARVLTVNYTAEPSLQEWTDTMLAAMNDPRFHPGIKLLFDRHLIGTPSPEFVRGVAEFVGGKGAYGMARMGQALIDFHGVTFEIFESAEAAEEWLRK